MNGHAPRRTRYDLVVETCAWCRCFPCMCSRQTPCVCGRPIERRTADPGPDVRAHQRTPEHAAWRARHGL